MSDFCLMYDVSNRPCIIAKTVNTVGDPQETVILVCEHITRINVPSGTTREVLVRMTDGHVAVRLSGGLADFLSVFQKAQA